MALPLRLPLAPRRAASAPRAAVFLDKDGTLIEDLPYNVAPERLRFTAGALAALRLFDGRGLPIIIVSNQPGLGTGRFTQREFTVLVAALERRIHDEAGVRLTGFYVCPHAPAGAAAACGCRKPQPGLLQQAAQEHGLDLAASWMIGDILDDVESGCRAGCRTVLLDVGNETQWRLSPERVPHYRCPDLLAAARIVIVSAAANATGGSEEARPGIRAGASS